MIDKLRLRYILLLFFTLLVIPTLACGGEETPTNTPQISTATPQAPAGTEDEDIGQAEPDKQEDGAATVTELADEIEPTPVSTDTPAPTPTPEPQVALLGDLVEQAGYSFAAVAVTDPAPTGRFYEEVEGSRLVAVEVIVGNVSGETFSSNPLNATLLDSDGFSYLPELGAGQDQLQLIEVQPGERVRGWIPFVIPNESSPASIKYEFSGFPTVELKSELLTANGEMMATDEVPLTAGEMLTQEFAGLGDLVEQDGYSLVAEVLEDPTTPGSLYEPAEGRKLVAVQIVVGNEDAQPFTVNPLSAYLIDAGGYVYTAELGGRAEQLELVDLGPGERVRGWVSFEIPEGSLPARIKYQMTGFPLIELYAGLGASESQSENPEAVETVSDDGAIDEVSIEGRIIGKWSGLQTSSSGDKVPAIWQFLEGGVMVIQFPAVSISYGAEWSVDGNRITIVTEIDPANPTYRDVEFLSDDVMRLTKDESGIEEIWTRIIE
jgi:hypothetical protein